MKTLWVAVSHHGYGHLGQLAPVLNLLAKQQPDIRIVIQSGHPAALLHRFLCFSFVHVEWAADQPILMNNAIDLDIAATLPVLQHYHAQAPQEIACLTRKMREFQVTAVLSNIGYLPLMAAREIGVPAIAFCSLNWADILQAYAVQCAELTVIVNAMAAWYAAADVFIAPQPFMPMPHMKNVIPVGPVARGGTRHDLTARFADASTTRYGLVSLGGIPYPLAYDQWPVVEGWKWIVSGNVPTRADLIDLQQLELAFPDLINSVDVLITKPGYGNIAESGCAGIPVACIPRPDWPETEALLSWLRQHVSLLMIEEEQLRTGACLISCAQWVATQTTRRQPLAAHGVKQVVEILQQNLRC